QSDGRRPRGKTPRTDSQLDEADRSSLRPPSQGAAAEGVIVLETERLLFREPEMQDLDAYCAMEMDPEVRRFVGGYPRTREEAERRFRNGCRHKTNLPFCSIILKAENRYIGRGGLHPMPGGAVGLGFYLARPYWGGGLATEA